MQPDEIRDILVRISPSWASQSFTASRLRHEDDGEFYDVWQITSGQEHFILKQTKDMEWDVYNTFFRKRPSYAPELLGSTVVKEDHYLLLEYISGGNLQRCTRPELTAALESMIEMQAAYWENTALAGAGYTYSLSLTDREKRGEYLNHPLLQRVYQKFLSFYATAPRTLCHDDCLPFNVLMHGGRAVFIDWEYGGILPYPVMLARLIAHGGSDPADLFYLLPEDREFAISYYYQNLIQKKGIPPQVYRQTLDYFLFYEYCEWVFVGNRYGATDSAYYQKYLPIALDMAERLSDNAPEH